MCSGRVVDVKQLRLLSTITMKLAYLLAAIPAWITICLSITALALPKLKVIATYACKRGCKGRHLLLHSVNDSRLLAQMSVVAHAPSCEPQRRKEHFGPVS